MLTVAYGEATLDRSNVYRWYKMFSEGREDVNDEERAERPSTSTTDEKNNEVEKMILANRRITVREVAEDLNISIGSCQSIFINDLGMSREPRNPGVVHHEFLPQGRTVNKEYYLQVMRNLREAIRQKRPDLWKNKNWLLHHDNAPVHTSLLVRDFLAKNNTLMMPQPPYSPDLAPCDFFLFPKLKRPMKGRRYTTLDEIKTASKEELKKILKMIFEVLRRLEKPLAQVAALCSSGRRRSLPRAPSHPAHLGRAGGSDREQIRHPNQNHSEHVQTVQKGSGRYRQGGLCKRESITIEKKKEICQLARNNPKMSKNEIRKRFSLPRTTVRDILTQAEKWENYTRFKGRFHISQRRLCGEGASISPAIIDEHLTNLNSILANSGYDPDNIYNADETGLFFQLIPDRTLAHKDENCRGVKRMKQRITVLLCCNSTGTDKRRLLIIGKSAKPRCFRNFSPHFYCTYTSNSKAWMTSSIFQEWLLQLNKQLVSEGRRILQLLDNSTSHCVPNDGLNNIKIHFLPPNMTASLQPLDSGIIKSFKAQYRKLQLQKMVELADAHLPTELRLDYAVRYCKMAWESLSPDSNSNCWNHTGIIRFTSTAAVEPLNYGNLLDRIRDIFAITPENLMTEREFQLVDDFQEAEMKLTDDNFLVSTVTAKDELGEDDDATVTQRLPSLREARTAAETVLLFLEHSKRATSDDVNLSADLLRRVYAISEGAKTQVVITDFFKKM
ncbi:hypothetical protein LAZ67_20001513 [Cordylochernes scorpioides]|uniref:DDE-1 domain-containing protein n=1 Tax=Cordylochernes scorpioides TaxID=51811 RepID=A0ABY6LK21_9ARAC|nr:hypothetical protein LAZ67_20001513 [Cordylochernes scorpioides]